MSSNKNEMRTMEFTLSDTVNKKIWILNHYATNMFYNKGGRHYWFAKYLKREGYDPVIFSCNVKHGEFERYVDTNDLWIEQYAYEIDVPFVFVNSSLYEGNGIKRIFNMLGFYRNVKKAAKEYAKKHSSPDVIYASSVHPLTLVAGIQLAKYFGVKCICEARDLWPESIVTYSKKLTKSNVFIKILYQGEKWIYKKSDALIFTQEGGPDYIREQKWDTENGGPIDMEKAYHINNGVDLEAFDENLKNYNFEDKDMYDPNTYKVVYAGAVRRINNLGIILDTAKEISDPKIKFIIFGDGNELEFLKQRVLDEKIINVVFKGRVNKQFIPSILNRSDLNIVHWEMSPLVRVGESYNKAFEYFAAGKPVFYTIRPGYSIVEKYNCGRLTKGYAPKELADGIQEMASLSEEEIEQMSINARNTAKIYDFKHLTQKLITIIEG